MKHFAKKHLCTSRAALLPLAIATVFASQSTAAQTADASTAAVQQLDNVIVTGTRSSGRTVSESLSPIDVLSAEDITATGASNLAVALNKLLPSLHFPSSAVNGPLSTVQPIILRGLSPNYVLILVDGKRYHTSAQVNYSTTNSRGAQAVDIASIPISAVHHLEVLRDGAAAQYGSDAIAGVVNIVLKHGADEGSNSVTVGGGRNTNSGGDQNSVSGSIGFDLGKEQKGWVRASWNYLNAQPTNVAEIGTQTNPAVVAANGGFAQQVYGNSGQKTGQLLLNFEYQPGEDATVYGYLDASRRKLTNYGYYRTAGASNNVAEVYPDGYLPLMPTQSNDFSGVLGVKGSTESGWYWDFSGVHGVNNISNQVDNSINVALYRNTGSSPSYLYVGSWRNAQTAFNLDVSKDFTTGFLPNPLTVSFGATWLHDRYQILAGEPDSYYVDPNGRYPGGAQTFFGLTPESAGAFSRSTAAAYVDLETDLTEALSIGVAGRYEHYSDAGSTRSGKLSMRYRFNENFSLRGTVSNGFRAPSLGQQYYQTISTIINSNVLTQTGTYRTTSAVAQALGAKPLEPEKSTNYSVGAVWNPTTNLSVTLDAYQIRISNQILLSDSFSLAQNPALAAHVATVSDAQIGAAQYFANAATSRARGVDLVSIYNWQLGDAGHLRLSASANYNKTELLQVAQTPAVLQQYAPSVELYGRASQGLLVQSTPRTKYIFDATWSIDDWNVYAGLTRYGAVTRVGNTPAGDQRFSARWLLDTSVSYRYDDWTITVGANNLTNQFPTRVSANNSFDYYYDELPYSPLSPFGFNGRYLFANVTYTW